MPDPDERTLSQRAGDVGGAGLVRATARGPEPNQRLLSVAGADLVQPDLGQGALRDGATVGPELAPETIARKKSSKPLIDTGQLRSSVTHRVVSGG